MPLTEAATVGGLKQCRQAQDQLEDAINGVMKAEQQLRENTREVRTFIFLILVLPCLPERLSLSLSPCLSACKIYRQPAVWSVITSCESAGANVQEKHITRYVT